MVFPTPVGMFRLFYDTLNVSLGFPHARGDVPPRAARPRATARFSPRPWGCSGEVVGFEKRALVFPTPVGMFLHLASSTFIMTSFPHARGDVPRGDAGHLHVEVFSPRPWGCSEFERNSLRIYAVFPTPVGMFRGRILNFSNEISFPHARGDVPNYHKANRKVKKFSPRPWGCSEGHRDSKR